MSFGLNANLSDKRFDNLCCNRKFISNVIHSLNVNTDSIIIGNGGEKGQVLTSNGPKFFPSWVTQMSSGSNDRYNILDLTNESSVILTNEDSDSLIICVGKSSPGFIVNFPLEPNINTTYSFIINVGDAYGVFFDSGNGNNINLSTVEGSHYNGQTVLVNGTSSRAQTVKFTCVSLTPNNWIGLFAMDCILD